MNNPHGIIIFGANGCGKTTLARELARLLNRRHMDIEDYAFAPSDTPYANERTRTKTIELMLADIEKCGSFVLSAVTGEFGEEITAMYDFAVLLTAPIDVRRKRVERRACEQFGKRVMPGGDMYEREREFIEFAVGRPLEPIERWAKTLNCPVIRVDGTLDYKMIAAELAERYRYIADPCGALSTALWKERFFPVPDDIKIVREKDFDGGVSDNCVRYFKLAHSLKNIGVSAADTGCVCRNAVLPADAPLVADFINRCYGCNFTAADVLKWTRYPVHDADLWVFICGEASGRPVALGIADFDSSVGEGALEWIQVLPEMRGHGFGTMIINELLRRLKGKATFVTVSGECDNPTNPEKLYRKCGFEGNDVWQIIQERR